MKATFLRWLFYFKSYFQNKYALKFHLKTPNLAPSLKRNSFYIVLVLLVWIGCKQKQTQSTNEPPIVKVYEDFLYPSDLKGMISSTLSTADSERVVKSFIDNWIRNKVLANKAQLNLTDEEKDVQKSIDEYRNSLLIYKYQMKLVNERIDTTVTENQLKEYYEKNKNNFELKKNLVQITFVKITESSQALVQIRNLFRSSRISDKEKLAALCVKYANNSFLDDEVWLDFNEILKELPIKNYDQEQFLRNNKFLEIKEGNYIYLINIKAYRIKNSISLMEFERDNIRSILLNDRKLKLLKEMELTLMKEAELNKDIEKYSK